MFRISRRLSCLGLLWAFSWGMVDPGAALAVEGELKFQDVLVGVADGAELQRELHRHTGLNHAVRLAKATTLTCFVQEEIVGGEKSVHGLLIPEGVMLDLNGSTLQLDLRSNSYGVRLSNRSGIRNGTIKIIRSEGKGLQSCWHSGVSVGAAYGDGGSTAKPGRFSTVKNWSIEGITIDQPFAASAIQLMSEACHGVIRDITVLDSDKALLGVGLDWGSVGPITAEDKQIPRMRQLWERGEIYSTHPHHVLIERIRVGKLLRNQDANDAGVRISACHNITVRDVEIETATTAVMIVGGDLGYEYARQDQREFAHRGHVIENVRIKKALLFGLVFNGLADNVWRAQKNHGYQAVRDPAHPGLDKLTVKNVVLHGTNDPRSQGIYAVSLSGAELEQVEISGFGIGVHVEDWVHGMTFRDCKVTGNKRDRQIEGATEPAVGVVFDPTP
ncbi:hypothetical protein [Schlesneria paludicola]|uniref:hypothetical protein n=1 Tax=Schlesneria paludicola TaxID=360056 RepID=UPI0012F8DDCD|nr:hypothetical protein [Schlesneria paludicola]